MRRVFSLLLVLSGLALAATASVATTLPTPAAPNTVTKPDWLRKPSAEDISHYYPRLARAQDRGGKVRVQCRLASDGVLNDCFVLSETPTGYGFGEAALNVATRFQMRPGTRDGQPVAGQIIVPISFRPQDPGRPALTRRRAALDPLFLLLFLWTCIA